MAELANPISGAIVIEKARSPLLDAIVAYANRLTLFGAYYRPYSAMSDVAAVSALLYAWAFASRFAQVSAAALGLVMLTASLVYKVVLEVKAALRKKRSPLVSPGLCHSHHPLFFATVLAPEAADGPCVGIPGDVAAALGLPRAYGMLFRWLLYGKPWPRGVLYPALIFESANHGVGGSGCARNSFCIAGRTGLETLQHGVVDLLAVCFSVCNRPVRARPAHGRYGRFSEAQLACVV